LKICGHGTVLALYRCAQNAFSTNVSELLRRKKQVEVVLLVYVDRRLLRTKFLPLFVQRCWLESRYHVRTAHEIFKVQSSPEKKNTAYAAQR